MPTTGPLKRARDGSEEEKGGDEKNPSLSCAGDAPLIFPQDLDVENCALPAAAYKELLLSCHTKIAAVIAKAVELEEGDQSKQKGMNIDNKGEEVVNVPGAEVPPLLKPLQAEFRTILDEVCTSLIRDFVFACSNSKTGSWSYYGFGEVEVYCNTSTPATTTAPATTSTTTGASSPLISHLHRDIFTHGDAQQMVFGSWYFHKKGGTYKSGTYKGMDLTLGSHVWQHLAGTTAPPTSPTRPYYLGVLIRSIVPLSAPEAEMIEGPCLVVDHLLRQTGHANIADFVGNDRDTLTICNSSAAKHVFNPTPCVHLNSNRGLIRLIRREDLQQGQKEGDAKGIVLLAPRVGLVPRSGLHMQFAGKLYRYLDGGTKKKHAKQRSGIIAALVAQKIATTGDLAVAKKEVQVTAGGTAKSVNDIWVLLASRLAESNGESKKDGKGNTNKEEPGKETTTTRLTAPAPPADYFGVLDQDVMKAPIITSIVAWASANGAL